jgi:cyclopropane fatty-acyl-phospholipid synthase-like methyltransferase
LNPSFKRVVETGYDRVAERYLASKDLEDPTTLAALEELARELPPDAAVLDLGCGAGVPATGWLARRFAVTGVDFSAKQLELARRNAPSASFIKADMTDLDFAPETFDAVVALQSIIHVPRTEHPALLENIRRWLKPGGTFLATLSVGEWEGEERDWEGWGAAMRWSHYDREVNLKMLRETGFEVASAEARTGRGTGGDEETWLWVLARKSL